MASKPKLLIFSHVSNEFSITGAEKLLLFFCEQMTPHFDCVLVAPNEGRLTILARQRGMTVKIYRIPLLHNIYTPHPGLHAEADRLISSSPFRALLKWIAREAPQIILVNTCVHFLPAAAGKRLGIPVVWQLTERIMDNGSESISTHLIDRYSDWLIGISETAVQSFPMEVRQSKITILPPSWSPLDLHPEEWPALRNEMRAKLGVGSGAPLVGMISSFLIETKGVHHFINMALSLKDLYPSAVFLIVGSVLNLEYEKLCRDMIGSAGAQHRFLFAGPQENIEAVYCALDIVVVPSLVLEGFGLTAMEGLLHAKPVVAYGSGGLHELLTAVGCEELLAVPENPASLAEKVRLLLNQPDHGRLQGQLNQLQIQNVFGPEIYANRLNAMIARWITEHPAWFQAGVSRQVRRRSVKARRHKPRGRKNKRKMVLRRRAKRLRHKRSVKPVRRRASKSRVRRSPKRRYK
ncbi:glycosyltransferase [Paenibacillus sp. JCM 10914]